MSLNATELEMLTQTRDAALESNATSKRLDKDINGNGQPGIKQRLQIIEDRHDNEKEHCKAGNATAAIVVATLSMVTTACGVGWLVFERLFMAAV